MHYLTIGAVFRTENSWLEEWIRYHIAVGVEHFILYNDDDDTHVSDRILKPYVEQGIVENVHMNRGNNPFNHAGRYRSMLDSMTGSTRWLAFIDLDEFILPSHCDDLRQLLQEYEDYNGLAINWSIYGTSGYIKRPQTQINHLLYRSETHWEPNKFVKSIVKPETVVRDNGDYVHYFPTTGGETVNESYENVTWITHEISTEKVRINHYVVRSYQDFWEVKFQRNNAIGAPIQGNDYFERHDRNEVFDDEISRRFGHIIQEGAVQ